MTSTPLFDRTQQAAEFLRERGAAPRALVILGTGLGGLGQDFDDRVEIPYGEIPHFPHSTSPGHDGALVLGNGAMVMAGRFHYYEGYSLADVTLPVRVAHALGARTLLLSSAVGGMNLDLEKGDIVAIEDHIHLMGESPLRGPNDDRLGPRFPDMSAPYDEELIRRAQGLAEENGHGLPRAVLVSVSGPQLETRAEYRFLRGLGADVVGMSVTPEAIVAAQLGMRACALSVVTDLCDPDDLEPVDVEGILAIANEAAPRLEKLILGLLEHA